MTTPKDPNIDNETVSFAAAHPGLVALRYTTLRFAILIGFLIFFTVLHVEGMLLWVLSFLGSGAASLFLLRKQRENMSIGLTTVIERRKFASDATRAAEDED